MSVWKGEVYSRLLIVLLAQQLDNEFLPVSFKTLSVSAMREYDQK